MKIVRRLPFFITLLLLVFITACKDGKDPEPEPTKTDLLVAPTWQGEKAMVSGMDVSTAPQFQGMFPDITTMTITFKRDGSYASTFTFNGQQVPSSGTWEFRENETKLHFELLANLGLDATPVIKELTADRLTLTTMVNYQVAIPGLPSQTVSVPADIYFVRK